MGKRLVYRRTNKPLILQGYSNVDWVGDFDTRRSTTIYFSFLANEVVRWTSKKQKIAALLSTKSKHMALFQTSTKAIWIRRLLASLDKKKENPTIIHLDNQSAIALIENLRFHARNKHIDVQVHFVRGQVQAKDIKVEYQCNTQDMVANILTKALPREKHKYCMKLMGVIDLEFEMEDNNT
jgi:hypothetical protein